MHRVNVEALGPSTFNDFKAFAKLRKSQDKAAREVFIRGLESVKPEVEAERNRLAKAKAEAESKPGGEPPIED